MSERGTFFTSYLYDYPNLVPALRKTLPAVCRDWGYREMLVEIADSEEKCRAIFGVMHCHYAGEESIEMENFILDVILPELPESHGSFSITVTPESCEFTTCFEIKDRQVQRLIVGPPETP